MAGIGGRFMQFVNSPTGPKTTHFWGPVANWGFVLAVSKTSPETGGRCSYACLYD